MSKLDTYDQKELITKTEESIGDLLESSKQSIIEKTIINFENQVMKIQQGDDEILEELYKKTGFLKQILYDETAYFETVSKNLKILETVSKHKEKQMRLMKR